MVNDREAGDRPKQLKIDQIFYWASSVKIVKVSCKSFLVKGSKITSPKKHSSEFSTSNQSSELFNDIFMSLFL